MTRFTAPRGAGDVVSRANEGRIDVRLKLCPQGVHPSLHRMQRMNDARVAKQGEDEAVERHVLRRVVPGLGEGRLCDLLHVFVENRSTWFLVLDRNAGKPVGHVVDDVPLPYPLIVEQVRRNATLAEQSGQQVRGIGSFATQRPDEVRPVDRPRNRFRYVPGSLVSGWFQLGSQEVGVGAHAFEGMCRDRIVQ